MTSELIPWRHIYDVTVNVHRQEMAEDVVHEQRTVIKFYVKLGKNMPEIKEDLQKDYVDSRFTNSCIHKWFHWFSDGRMSVKDDPRSGPKVTVSTDKRIAAIVEYVMKDRRITVRQVGESFDIGWLLKIFWQMYLECEGFVHVGCLECLFQNRRRLGYKYAQNFNRDCRMKVFHFLIKW